MKLVCILIVLLMSSVCCYLRFLHLHWKSSPSIDLFCLTRSQVPLHLKISCIAGNQVPLHIKLTILCIWKDLEGSKCLSPSQAYLLTCPQVKQDLHYLENKTMYRNRKLKKIFLWIFNGQANLVFHRKFKFILCQ